MSAAMPPSKLLFGFFPSSHKEKFLYANREAYTPQAYTILYTYMVVPSSPYHGMGEKELAIQTKVESLHLGYQKQGHLSNEILPVTLAT